MAHPDIHALAQQWLTAALEELEESLSEGNGYPEEEEEAYDSALTEGLRSTEFELRNNDFSKVKGEVDDLLKGEGIDGFPKELYRRLCREILKVKQVYFREASERLEGRYKTVNGSAPSPHMPPGSGASASEASSSATLKTVGPLLSQVLPEYFKDFERRAPKTLVAKQAALRRFVSIIGDKPIATLADGDGRKYRETMSLLPTNMSKRFPGKTIEAVLKKTQGKDIPRLSLSTINMEMKRLTHFFHWAMKKPRRYLQENPLQGLRYEDVEEENYEPFTDDDLKAIFLSTEYQNQRETNPPRYWLPLVLLFSGARREEISNLALEDIKDEAPIPYFDVVRNHARERRLKTKTSRRVFPVHSTLIQFGFLRYVVRCRSGEGTILFPNYGTSTAPTGGDTVSKWFTRLLEKKGITGKKALKSCRPTFTTRLHEAGVDGETRRQLQGHAGKDVHETVYLKPSLPVLRAAIEKLRFDWLREKEEGLPSQENKPSPVIARDDPA